jgi:hypothetical protein
VPPRREATARFPKCHAETHDDRGLRLENARLHRIAERRARFDELRPPDARANSRAPSAVPLLACGVGVPASGGVEG